MRLATKRWRAGLLGVLLLLVAACGQKPGTHVEASATGAPVVTGPAGTVQPGDATAPEEAATGAPGDASASTSVPAGGPAATGPASGAAAPPAGGGASPAAVRGTDRTGVSADKIVLAIHAPVTGAAPLPQTSFQKSADLYWRHVNEVQGQKVLGRGRVEVAFKDDKYQPNTAVQACRELAASAFLLVGGGGTDQIQACARFASQSRIPYLSAGVTENGLRGLPGYFAASMTYKQQGALLAQYVQKNLGGRKVAAVITDTPNFDDARDGWEEGRQAAGLDYYKTLRHPKGDSSWYNTFANELKGNGVEVVYINTAPVDYIRFAQQSAEQGFKPQFVGVGITMGLNAVLASGCPHVDGGIFLSPFPGLDWARSNVPELFSSAERFGAPADDLALALWGIARIQHELFKRYESTYGSDLTREDFRDLVERQQGLKSGVFPDNSWSPQDHFGANQVHVLRASCGKGEHETLATFATGF